MNKSFEAIKREFQGLLILGDRVCGQETRVKSQPWKTSSV